MDKQNSYMRALLNMRRLQATRIEFDIPYLTEAIGGIRKTDLYLFGAGTGSGKTQMACQIAFSAAKNFKNVVLYALEAEAGEVKYRLLYKRVADLFFNNRDSFPKDLHLNWKDWSEGKFDTELKLLEKRAAHELELDTTTLKVITPTVSDFSRDDFSLMYKDQVREGADLIILDHVHYLHWAERSEYDAVRKHMATLRDLVNTHELPVVVMSHLRKDSTSRRGFMPTFHELHGSSELAKRANAVVMFAKAKRDLPHLEDDVEFTPEPGSTLFWVAKARSSADNATSYVALVQFDMARHSYSPHYYAFWTDEWAETLRPLSNHAAHFKFERWMLHAKELGL